MQTFTRLFDVADFIFSKLPSSFSFATPLGLGKPNQLINLLYQRFAADKTRKLKIFTALSLDLPEPKSELEARFVTPFLRRHFGENYPRLLYAQDLIHGRMPANISVEEFYFQAGQFLGNRPMQGAYNSLNYTHVARAIFNAGIDLIVQLIAVSPDGKSFSLSCNPDLTLDLVDLHRQSNKPVLIVGVVHPDLPYLGGEAEVPAEFFDAVLVSDEIRHSLFAPPRIPVDREEYLIGLHASRLIRDDGTLQIGIGALSDAVVYALLLRHQNNEVYHMILPKLEPQRPFSHSDADELQHIETFSESFRMGLYGTSEMIMDGFMHLRKAGILKREIFDGDELRKRYLHGAFFLGSKEFYTWLNSLSPEDYMGLSMTRVSKINDLYDPHELALRRQRKNARFLNTCMNVTLLGGAASDALEDGQVVSGVGGQYNFVAMSQELPDSHSVLMLRATRLHKGKRVSNIVYGHGHLTIPRHLRDVVVTEYGIAAVRGQSDEVTIQRILNITDSEFQPALLRQAKDSGKIARDYEIPMWARNNTPARIQKFFAEKELRSLFPTFPFGSDFTPVEERLQSALLNLKKARPLELLTTLTSGLLIDERNFSAELARMDLSNWFHKKLLLGSLAK